MIMMFRDEDPEAHREVRACSWGVAELRFEPRSLDCMVQALPSCHPATQCADTPV